jgi:hypothetical protein
MRIRPATMFLQPWPVPGLLRPNHYASTSHSGLCSCQSAHERYVANYYYLSSSQPNELPQHFICAVSITSINVTMAESYGTSPPKFGRIGKLRGFLPLNEEPNVMATHGSGTLTNLIRSRSTASLHAMTRRPVSFLGRDTADEEEGAQESLRRHSHDGDDMRPSNGRRESILNDPRMRSMRLIGNSNPRYRWHQYWKPEEELKKMKKPMYVKSQRNIRRLSGDCLPHLLYLCLDSRFPHPFFQ